ncbi:hypothetical protein DIC66_22550 [Rhodoferax lacus]|uniref:Polysaccharide biosynthesis protein n=1 Tax=Rhodoferax lacus TaxID=2184758 RepID=A0A3E1R5H3_9BURK|nr:hypothetical protein [Rhodoferax lacus]RFO94625.1 hypothetical protein DIC66_22550 [Rhodoferax lacus]
MIRIALRALGMMLNAATFALAARTLSTVHMGIWALATALTTITLSLDLGLSCTLRNRLADKPEEGQMLFQQVFSLCLLVASVYCLAILVGGGIALGLCWPCSEFWNPLRQTMVASLLTGVSLILLRLPFNLAANACYSYNEPNFPIYWELFNFSTSFLLVATAAYFHGGPVLSTAAYLLGGTLTGLCSTAHWLRRRGWSMQLKWPQHARAWIRGGASFGFLQLAALGLTALPSFLVGSLVQLEDVTIARASMILCQATLLLHLAHAMPLWTEFTQLRGSVDCQPRLVALRRRLHLESGLLLLAFTCMALMLPWAIGVWLDRNVDIRVTTAFCAWGAGCGLYNLHSLVLNGGGRPLLTAAAVIPGGALATLLAWLLSPTMGTPGIALAFALGAVVSATVMMLLAHFAMRSTETERSSLVTR